MAKLKHNNFLDTVVEVMTNAKEEGALHLYAEGKKFNGRYIETKGKKLFHFGTTGYLGLEQDARLKAAAIEAIERYGTQFPLSKSYISHPLYAELEEKVAMIYGRPVIITKNSTLGHMAVIPSVVKDGDGVVLDHQVHWSVQNAVQPLKLRSVPVEMIRHSRLDMLEDKIKKLRDKCRRIWYMADGIYSMYGDYAPLEELTALTQKYEQLRLYFDDVHGMSWKGKNGSGYVMSVLKDLPEQVILFGTLSKTFGASGAVMVTSNEKIFNKVKNFGGPLTFSAQLEPASVGAAIASANIHLSDEIYDLQEELADKTSYFNECLNKTELPLIAENDSPVFYIGTGMPITGFNLVNRLINRGYYVNTGIFPAVPVKNTGLRITISRHNREEEIRGLTEVLNEEFYLALKDTNTDLDRVNFAFGRNLNLTKKDSTTKKEFQCEVYSGIHEMEERTWNCTIGQNGLIDWQGMKFLEAVFSGNKLPEHNYEFYYFQVKDKEGKLVLLSFATYGLWKEDMLAPVSVSKELEEKRKEDPYYHTSYTLSLGSFLTEGDHLFLDRNHPKWKKALEEFLKEMELLEKKLQPETVLLRDFDPADKDISDIFHNRGFVKVDMPDSCRYDNFDWTTIEDYAMSLSSRSRRHLKKEILEFQDFFEIQINARVTSAQLKKYFDLYKEVKDNNPALNTFEYPFKLFETMNQDPNWEFIQVVLKENQEVIGVMFCYKNSTGSYVPDLIGMDYRYSRDFNVYRQLLFQTILRAKELRVQKIDFGLTAAFEKRKVGATVMAKCAYLQARDNFALESLDWLRKD
ncbi:aminotransferase class I/II [Christiangramia fulva]|uniref:Aminotransferase class I/II n=1 Tax=Christiangramia fulva TaxID=2126553 RepID=A0A2R3Z1V8_9FLAO|nr:aminotransferase class I/II-fold pyridoxal phosphate-dependent enzyme [Christiangramia fulva]AVR44236.1 aminotransferase class I/II [Christiangramia fulva]